ARAWIRYSENAVRETNTMPQWAGSCWYYLRFCDPRNSARFVGHDAEQYWMIGNTAVSAVSEPLLEEKTDVPSAANPLGTPGTRVFTSANPLGEAGARAAAAG